MPTIRQMLVAAITKCYPFFSGCGTFANMRFIQQFAGISDETVWARVPGGEVLVPLNDYVGRAAYYVGDLDRKISWICTRIVRPGDTVLDIGANLGLVTILLSSLAGRNGRVHAFEPNPLMQTLLDQSLERNSARNVRLHRFALGAQEGNLALSIPAGDAGKASLVRRYPAGETEVISVPVKSLSAVIAEEGITSIRLIKMDVEGYEPEVLRGGREALSRIRPQAILFELNDAQGPARKHPTIQILRELDYGFFTIPRCIWRMRLKRFDPEGSEESHAHDFLAVPKGKPYEMIALAVKASV